MFDVTLTGVEELLRTFDAAAARVHSLQYTIPREFENWRTEDMHSQYPKPQVIRQAAHPARQPSASGSRGRGKRRQASAPEASAPAADIPAGRCCAPISTSS